MKNKNYMFFCLNQIEVDKLRLLNLVVLFLFCGEIKTLGGEVDSGHRSSVMAGHRSSVLNWSSVLIVDITITIKT